MITEAHKREAGRLRKRLGDLLSAPLTLVLTDNRRSMISVRRDVEPITLRLHHMFLKADEALLVSLSKFIAGTADGPAMGRIRAFIRSHGDHIRRRSGTPAPRPPALRPEGRTAHLREVFDRLNRDYFGSSLQCHITWGRRLRKPGRKRIRLGSYSPSTRTIRINPILDQHGVPGNVLDFIVFHEMLHLFLGCRIRNGRRASHDALFKKLEGRYAGGPGARVWIKDHLPRLLSGPSLPNREADRAIH